MPELETVSGYLDHIRYHALGAGFSDSGVPFLVAGVAREDATGMFVTKGEMLSPRVGQLYRFYGQWRDDKKHGDQYFHFYSFETMVDKSVEGLVDYLDRFVFGLGPVRARKIVEHFGPERCLEVLYTNPERLEEVKGIGPVIAKEVMVYFQSEAATRVDPVAYAAIYNLLADEMPPPRLVRAIIKDFGSSAVDVLCQNPYILLGYSGMGWDKVDRVARKKFNYPSDGLGRYRAAVMEAIQQYTDDGDTWVTENNVYVRASKKLNVNVDTAAVDSLASEGLIVAEEYVEHGRKRRKLAPAGLYFAEQEIAHRLVQVAKAHRGDVILVDTAGLEEEQIEACKFIINNPVCILEGAPGVGKSTTIAKIVKAFVRYNNRVVFAAPTGKAAKRADELVAREIPDKTFDVTTIHRALMVAPSTWEVGVPVENAKFGRGRDRFGFASDEEHPFDADAAILDEASMIEVELMLSWLQAIPPGARLVIVGDPNQLPSIGPGAVLRDMIDAGIPTFSLKKPRRNSGRVTMACHAIKDGRVIRPSETMDLTLGENWIHFEQAKPEAMAGVIADLFDHTDRDKMWDIQVISPQIDKEYIGCNHLNELLAAKLNPGRQKYINSGVITDKIRYGPGDKVVRLKNGFVHEMIPLPSGDEDLVAELFGLPVQPRQKTVVWREKEYSLIPTYVVNGDIGRVVDVFSCKDTRYVVVKFRNPDRLCALPAGDAQLALAYAITVHKSQGSGFPVVILPVHSSFYWNRVDETGLWCRELFYTGLSRVIDLAITVGEFASIEQAVSRRTIHKRRTNLPRFIREELAMAPRILRGVAPA